MYFRHRFWNGSDVVSEGFSGGFSDVFSAPCAPTGAHCRYARNTRKPQYLLGFEDFEEEAHKAENHQNALKINEKLHVVWKINLEGILG